MTEYPAVTFVLYRAAEKEDGQYSPEDWTPVDKKTLPRRNHSRRRQRPYGNA